MARDEHDKDTGDLLKRKPGRPPKYCGRAMTPAERKAAERARRELRGEVQVWVTPAELAILEEMRSRQD